MIARSKLLSGKSAINLMQSPSLRSKNGEQGDAGNEHPSASCLLSMVFGGVLMPELVFLSLLCGVIIKLLLGEILAAATSLELDLRLNRVCVVTSSFCCEL